MTEISAGPRHRQLAAGDYLLVAFRRDGAPVEVRLPAKHFGALRLNTDILAVSIPELAALEGSEKAEAIATTLRRVRQGTAVLFPNGDMTGEVDWDFWLSAANLADNGIAVVIDPAGKARAVVDLETASLHEPGDPVSRERDVLDELMQDRHRDRFTFTLRDEDVPPKEPLLIETKAARTPPRHDHRARNSAPRSPFGQGHRR